MTRCTGRQTDAMRTFFLALLLACSQAGFAQHEYGIFNAYLGPCTVDSVNGGVDATAHRFAFRVGGVRDTIPEAVWLLDGLRNWGWHSPPFPELNTNSTYCRTRDTLLTTHQVLTIFGIPIDTPQVASAVALYGIQGTLNFVPLLQRGGQELMLYQYSGYPYGGQTSWEHHTLYIFCKVDDLKE